MMANAVFVIHRRVEQVVATGSGVGMTNPMTTAGDIIVGGSAGVPNRLAIGAAGKVLGVVAGLPAWVDPTGGGGGAVDSVNGQTGVVVLDAADVGADVAGAATAAVAAHMAASDPHTQYLTLAEASSAYAPLAHVGSGGAAHANAIAAGAAGFMTGADKTKLDGVAAGATQNSADATLLARANHTGTQTASTISDFESASRAQTEAELVAGTNVTITPSGSGATRQLTIAAAGGGGSTNLSTTTSTTTLTVNSDTGTDAVLPAATGSVAGVLTAADKTKLDGIATGATQNSSDAFLRARGNHTGTQTASTISDFTEATQDVVGSSVVAGANVTVTYDDGTGLTTVAATGGGMANPMTTAGDMIVGGAAGVPTMLPAGSNTQVMTIVGGVPTWSTPAAGGGSLVNFTENLSTSSPNAVTYAARLLPVSAGATDIDFVVEPKGVGALLRKVPDGTVAGGVKRGSRATDLQVSRTAATQVASGADSFAAGADNTASGAWSCAAGYSNTASGSYSVVFGYGNLAQQSACVALGQSNSALGAQSVAIGNNNTASGGIAFALGNGCTASGTSAFAMGATCTASGPYSQATGRQSTTRGVIGAKAHSSGQQSTLGDAQTIQLVSRAATTDATSTRLTADNTAASAINQVLIPTNSAVKFRGDVVARNTANGDCATWSVSGLIKNVAGTVTLVGTPTATMDTNDTGAAGWALTVTADNTNKSLALAVVGAAATSIRWVSAINTTEVTA